MTPVPHRWIDPMLRGLLPRAVRDEAMDDLADLYALRLARDGRPAADSWYRRHAVGYAIRLRLASLPGGPLTEQPRYHQLGAQGETMGRILADLRYGARAMLRTPVFTSIAVLTLALGIGANAAIFSVVHSVLLRPLPFREPDRLVQIWEARADRGWNHSSFTRANFWDVRDMNRSLEAVGAIGWASASLTGLEHPERLNIGTVSVGFFRALGITPVAGRIFADGEDRPAADTRLALLGHRLWTSRFGGEASVVGRTIALDGVSHRVIGVLPAGTPWLDAADLFIPLVNVPNQDRGSFELTVIGRLARGVTLAAADADLERVARRLVEQYPEVKGMGVTIESGEGWIASDALRRALWVLTGAVGFLLLIACVNLANLLLARATGRVRERAMRTALGAARSRLVQAALTESLLLGLLGTAAGLGLAFGIVHLLRAFNPGDIPRLAEVAIDRWVLAATLGIALLTSVVTGLVPALRTPYVDLVVALREGERSVAGNRRAGKLRSALVSVEVALSLVLLVGAGLLIRSFDQILGVERGFRTENRLIFDVGFPSAETDAQRARAAQLVVDVQSRIEALPQVASAAAVSMRPLRGVGPGMGFAAPDKPAPARDAVPWAGWRFITRDYFKTMGVPLIAGRDFTEQDKAGRPWRVIISKRIAERLWPGENALGRTITLWKGQGGTPAEVIGIVGDMRDWDLAENQSYTVYIPFYTVARTPTTYVVNTTTPAATFIPMLRSILAEVDPSLPLARVQSLDDIVGESVASRRFTMLLLAALAGVALLLALGGVYGVLSYTVSRRRPELGVRIALGASAGSVMRLVMLQGMRPVVLGLIVGVAGAVALSRFMASLLFGVTPIDVPTYIGVAALLMAAAALACYVPARGAMRVDVLAALREE